MFYVANDSKCVLAAPEGFAQIDLCVCFSVDVNQTKHNERKYFFPFFFSLQHLHIGRNKQNITRLLQFEF